MVKQWEEEELGEGERRKERVDESPAWSRACGGSWERNADTGTPHEGSL